MFAHFVERFVPSVLLPRRYRTEKMVRRLFLKISGDSIEEWFALKKLNERQIARYFDTIDERLGDRITSHGHCRRGDLRGNRGPRYAR